ncbi:ankyrin repeat-containing domain protein [Phaeosphaeriaceae sp. PMI808]|nr:ankyrin repeat-containing domain protein [Phaeosphaeriaceae sp. PMI808]
MDPSEFSWDDVVVVGRNDVLQANDDNILPQDQDTMDRVRTWLHPTDYEGEGSEYHKHVSSHLLGTGNWLLTSDTYQQWHGSDEHGMLWLRGIPGSGKSVLLASIIHHLLQEQVPVLYFFFRQIVDSNHTPRAALKDWLAQVLIYSPPFSFNKKMDEHQNSNQPRELNSLSTADLWQHLRTALAHLPKSYIVVDALDEMDYTPETDIFLQNLSDLAQWRPSQVKTLVASRPVANIERALRKESLLHLRLDEDQVDVDIGTYVRSRIATSMIPPEFHGPIQAAVPGRAKGLFLYAKLAMDTLLEDGVDVQKSLRRLPDNLHLMYSQLLHEHAKKTEPSQDVQLLVMQWITHSIRPLRLIEMSNMLSYEPLFGNQDLGAAKSYVRSACGPLLELLPDETLCVIHHSLTEYLQGTTRIEPTDYPILATGLIHKRLALICLSYLQNGCLEGVEPEPEPPQTSWSFQSTRRIQHTLQKPLLAPFTRYAALYWHVHAKRCRSHGMDQIELNTMLNKFTAHAHFQRWVRLAKSQLDTSRTITPLSMAIQLGLSDYLQLLLSQPGTDCNEGAPITWAADKGYADVVELLIQNGANVDQFDDEGYTALHRAAAKNQSDVVRLLLQAGCDMRRSTRFKPYGSRSLTSQCDALWYACSYGHREAVTELQPYIKSSEEVGKALAYAVANKRTWIVQQLLDHPLVDLETPTAKYLLKLACSHRHADTISLLLAAGADATEYALHALAESKEVTAPEDTVICFKLLLDAGASFDQENPESYFNTPLHQAADVVAAKILVEAGANVDAYNKSKETPLHTCTDIEVLKFLVNNCKVNLERTDNSGKTLLLQSMSNRFSTNINIQKIMTLVDLGADVNVVDKDGNGVFHLAVKNLYYDQGKLLEELITCFCAAGADIDRINSQGEAPIHLTKIETESNLPPDIKRSTLFETLVAAGASLTPASASISRTPFFTWISKSICEANQELPKILEILLKSGASLTQIQFLIDQGLDPHVVDTEGNTLWHEAATKTAQFVYDLAEGIPEPFSQLIQLGVDPTRPNHHGRTSLHILSSNWPEAAYYFQRSSGQLNTTTAFDVVLALFPNADVVDEDGVTPLHIASTFSEFLVRRLLERNADPSRVTNEGCNAIHVSARSRNPNILGMLLQHLRSSSATAVESAVNAKDLLGRPPLYYACLVGSYESAKYLVDAGATVDFLDYESSPWKGLAELEVETRNWRDFSQDKKAGAVLIADKHRPTGQSAWYWNTRIDELIALLSAKTTSLPAFIDQAIADAAPQKVDYIVECLLRARRSMPFAEELVATSLIDESVNRRKTERTDQEKPCKNCNKLHILPPLQRARVMRDYHIFPEILLAEDQAHLSSNVRDLVTKGFASVLQHLVASAGQEFLESMAGEETQNNLQGGSYGAWDQEPAGPLLLSASARDEPNMDVIRLLIEQAALDVNAQRPIRGSAQGSYSRQEDIGRPVDGESILHILVRSEHWWHVSEGLPYFLERGANTELRNTHGETPLSAVLNRCGWLIFDKHAVELLIHYGADVNSIDTSGHSCLAKACSNMEMAILLLNRGAVVTQDVFGQAFNSNNADLLELLLSRGADPNVRKEPPDPQPAGYDQIPHNNRYPLHLLFSMSDYRLKTDSDHRNYERMVKMMLDHGANPCAEYDNSTVLHELIKENSNINSFFTTPNVPLNLESRNSSGRTPLMATSLRTSSLDKTEQHNVEGRSVFNLLVSHGADIRTRDYVGNNVLHLFVQRGSFISKFDDFVPIVQQAPELINQRNNEGNTPLHLAMKIASYTNSIGLFLDNGGDIHATDGKGNSMLHLLVTGQWELNEQGKLTGKVLNLFTHLLSKGTNINARNEAGETSIYSFLRSGTVCLKGNNTLFQGSLDQPVYGLFTEHGIDWQALNAQGQNLLHVVASAASTCTSLFGNPNSGIHAAERFNALLKLGLDAGLEDEAGRTPLDCAAEVGSQEILELFQKK